jgi:hypothetical protein
MQASTFDLTTTTGQKDLKDWIASGRSYEQWATTGRPAAPVSVLIEHEVPTVIIVINRD